MSDNNADYNGSGQDEYFATNDSTQADYRQSQDGYNQPASQPHNPNPYASQQPVQGYAPGAQGNNIPGGTYGNGQPYGQSAAYGSSVPAYGSAAPAYGQPTQPAQPAQPIYGQPTYGPTDYAQSAQTPYYQEPTQPAQPAQPIYGQPTYGPTDYAQSAQTPYYQEPTQPQYTQSAYNQPPTYAQQTYYQATQQQPGYGYAQKSKIVAGLLGLFLGTLGVHNFYLGYTGKAVAQLLLTLIGWIILIGPIISGIWALIEAVLILCSSYGSNWHRDGHGQELQD